MQDTFMVDCEYHIFKPIPHKKTSILSYFAYILGKAHGPNKSKASTAHVLSFALI